MEQGVCCPIICIELLALIDNMMFVGIVIVALTIEEVSSGKSRLLVIDHQSCIHQLQYPATSSCSNLSIYNEGYPKSSRQGLL
jgi:hypothetical protein